MKQSVFIGFFITCLMLPSLSGAEDAIVSPHALIQGKTEQLISLVKSAKGYYSKNPDKYFKQLNEIIDPVVDFSTFTRGVMGRYGTSNYYRSLNTKAEKEAFKQNYKRFIGEFKQGLVSTYGKGLMTFNGQKVKVLPPSKADEIAIKKGEVVEVVQLIKDKSKTHEIIFKMRPNKHGRWMLRNMIIDNINLGELYQKQFAAAMKKHNGDFAKVVDNWLQEIESGNKPVK